MTQALAEMSEAMRKAEEDKINKERMETASVEERSTSVEEDSDADESKIRCCALCNSYFKRNRDLAVHSRTFHSLTGFKCKTCFAFFQIKSEYESHPCARDSDIEAFSPMFNVQLQSESQSSVTSEEIELNIQESENQVKDESGTSCGDSDSQSNENSECDVTHKKGSKGSSKKPKIDPCKCSYCNKLFPTSIQRENHEVQVHTGDYKICDVCGKQFSNVTALKAHVRRHTEANSYKCQLCNKEYSWKQDLKNHLSSVHTTERPFICSICGKGFKRKPHLVHHEELHQQGIANYKCNMCDATFRNWSRRNVHVQDVHTGRKFPCKVCGKGFTAITHLRCHEVVHSGEKPFKCPHCEAV
ncbi:zinc finger protein 711-like [Amphiura filiformis]|uniref:zinc finger protein 711-like n=1 Tax=Amphiura filiformis TaxID=82378 RepID=UPI003B21DE21